MDRKKRAEKARPDLDEGRAVGRGVGVVDKLLLRHVGDVRALCSGACSTRSAGGGKGSNNDDAVPMRTAACSTSEPYLGGLNVAHNVAHVDREVEQQQVLQRHLRQVAAVGVVAVKGAVELRQDQADLAGERSGQG